MIGGEKKKLPGWLLLLLLLIQLSVYSQAGRMDKVKSLYTCMKDYGIECPKTVLAIAIYETGWMECKHCSYQYNNLFGFRANHDYLKFASIYECLTYLKEWQATYYDPWKVKHPNGTYYEYLYHVRYARSSMSSYVRTIKAIERLVSQDVEELDELQMSQPILPEDNR